MANVGEAEVQISHSGSGETVGALQSVGSALGSLATVAVGLAAGGLAAIGAGFALATSEAMEAQRVMALTESTIKATGGAAGLSAGQISDMASQLQNLTGIADDAIQGGQNLLLTFRNIGADVFPAATKAMLDMSVAMGQDLKSSAIQLGKALNDPINGITALQRIGVTFSKTQIDLINNFMKMGDVASAQKVILDELNAEFGGASEAIGKTFAGQLEIAKQKMLDIAEAAGAKLLPVLSELATAALPLLETFATAAANSLTGLMGSLEPLLPSVVQFATVLTGAFANLRAGMPVLDLLGRLFPQAFNPEVRAAIDSIMGSLQKIGEALSPAVASFVTAFGDALKTAFGAEGGQIIDNITNAFSGLATFLTNNGPAIAAAADFIGKTVGSALAGIVTIISGLAGAFGQLLSGDFAGALQTIGDSLTAFANGVSQAFGGVDFSTVIATWQGNLNQLGMIISLGAANAAAAATDFANGIVNGVAGVINGVVSAVTGAINSAIAGAQALVGGMAAVGAAIGQGLVNGAAGVVMGIVKVVVAAVIAAIEAAKAAAGVASPSKETMYVGEMMAAGFAAGLAKHLDDTERASEFHADRVKKKRRGGAGAVAEAVVSATRVAQQSVILSDTSPTSAGGYGGYSGGGGSNITINLYANGVNNPAELVNMIEREIRMRGQSFAAVA